jgi:hypothetical protein
MNRTLKEATVRRYYYESHAQLRAHLAAFVDAYNFAKRLKALRGLTPYEHIVKCWTEEPNRFILDPTHLSPGLNMLRIAFDRAREPSMMNRRQTVGSRPRADQVVEQGLAEDGVLARPFHDPERMLVAIAVDADRS